MLFIHRVGAAQETANESFPGKKAMGDPCRSIEGNEPCGRRPKQDHFQPRGSEMGPPSLLLYYIHIDIFILSRMTAHCKT